MKKRFLFIVPLITAISFTSISIMRNIGFGGSSVRIPDWYVEKTLEVGPVQEFYAYWIYKAQINGLSAGILSFVVILLFYFWAKQRKAV